MTQIKATLIANVEDWLRTNLPDMEVDSICAIQRIQNWDFNGTTAFIDKEEDTEKHLTFQDFVNGLVKMFKLVDGGKLYVSMIGQNPVALADIDNWDVEAYDALFQLAYHGEVIYG